MKKFLVAGLFAIASFTVSAQQKIGYISTDELIGVMPETDKADAELKEYQASLAQQGQDLMADLQAKDSAFVIDSVKLSNSMKEIKRQELIALYQRVQNWNQQAQEMYQAKAQQLIAPIRDKALETVKVVAKENGYAYVLESQAVIVGPPGDDVLPLIKKKLGIKDTPPAAKPAAPKKN